MPFLLDEAEELKAEWARRPKPKPKPKPKPEPTATLAQKVGLGIAGVGLNLLRPGPAQRPRVAVPGLAPVARRGVAAPVIAQAIREGRIDPLTRKVEYLPVRPLAVKAVEGLAEVGRQAIALPEAIGRGLGSFALGVPAVGERAVGPIREKIEATVRGTRFGGLMMPPDAPPDWVKLRERVIAGTPKGVGPETARSLAEFIGWVYATGGLAGTAGKIGLRAIERVAPKIAARAMTKGAVKGALGFGLPEAAIAYGEQAQPGEIARRTAITAAMGAGAAPAGALAKRLAAGLAPKAEHAIGLALSAGTVATTEAKASGASWPEAAKEGVRSAALMGGISLAMGGVEAGRGAAERGYKGYRAGRLGRGLARLETTVAKAAVEREKMEQRTLPPRAAKPIAPIEEAGARKARPPLPEYEVKVPKLREELSRVTDRERRTVIGELKQFEQDAKGYSPSDLEDFAAHYERESQRPIPPLEQLVHRESAEIVRAELGRRQGVPPGGETAKAKESWQMTYADLIADEPTLREVMIRHYEREGNQPMVARLGSGDTIPRNAVSRAHRWEVEQARTRGESIPEAVLAEQGIPPAEGAKPEEAEIGTLEKPNTVGLAERFRGRFVEGGIAAEERPDVARRDVENTVANWYGTDRADLRQRSARGEFRWKNVEEAYEYGLVKRARDIARDRTVPDEDTRWQRMQELYQAQVPLTHRTSEQMRLQQFSTPAPLAYLMNRRLAVRPETTVFEPTAGNGMLLLTGDPRKAEVNELDKGVRLRHLEDQGFAAVHNEDAIGFFDRNPDKRGRFDVVVMNPPFGKAETKTYDGFPVSKLEHQIAVESLEGMKDDGKAGIIIGGHNFEDAQGRSRDRLLEADRLFFNYLYSHYNVGENIDIAGSVYSRMGTDYPIRLLVIEGRKPVPDRAFAPESPDQVKRADSFDALRDLLGVKEGGFAVSRPAGLPGAPGKAAEGRGPEREPSGEPPQPPVGVPGEREPIPGGGRPGAGGGVGEPGRETGAGGAAGEPGVPPRGVGPGILPEPGKAAGGGEAVTAEPGKPGFGEGNRIFTQEAKDAALERLREKMRGRVQVGIDPTMVGELVPIAGYYVEGGIREFERFASEVVNDLGESVRPFLRAAWNQATQEHDEALKSGRIAAEGVEENLLQSPYKPRAGGTPSGLLVPHNMVQHLQDALDRLEEKHGDFRELVNRRAGYTDEQLDERLAPEQVDAVVMGLDAIDAGRGVIIGDAPGIGKGRVAATIVQTMAAEGHKPIFMTETARLFSDFWRDLNDVGAGALRPLIIHAGADGNVRDAAGNILFKAEGSADLYRQIAGNPEQVLQGYDYILAPYTQIRKAGNAQQRALEVLGRDRVIITDEAHMAAGADSNTGKFMQGVLADARAVIYMSATYAKRPETMALYHRTGLGEAHANIDQLQDALVRGGTPLAEYIGEELARRGDYTRREWDASQVRNIRFLSNEANRQVDTKRMDDATSRLRAIRDFSTLLQDMVRQMNKEFRREGEVIDPSGQFTKSITSTNFASTSWNALAQLQLAMKADYVADQAIAAARAGQKPLINVQNTMESFITWVMDQDQVAVGAPIPFSFKDVLRKALRSCLQYAVTDERGNKRRGEFEPDRDLPDPLRKAYSNALEWIDLLETDLAASPIDWMRQRLQQAGLRVGELTGRKFYVDYSGDKPRLAQREVIDHQKTIRQFNAGELDVVIMNQSAALGVSMHASEKFRDQAQRHMTVAQANLNIDTFMQSLGRVNRRGQVVPPEFSLIWTALPSERRPAIVLQRKLAMLNANTTADAEAGSEWRRVPDMMNSVGDEIVLRYLQEHRELNQMLDDPLGLGDREPKIENAMARVTGRLGMLPVDMQEVFYHDVEAEYVEQIAYLDQIGQNNLVARHFDYDAQTVRRFPIFQGSDESDPFTASAYVEQLSTKVQRRPYNRRQIERLVEKELGGLSPKDHKADFVGQVNLGYSEYRDGLLKRREAAGGEGEQGRIDSIMRQAETALGRTQGRLEMFHVGRSYSITTPTGEQLRAVLMGFRRSAATGGNPGAPSRVSLLFATNDNSQVYRIPLSAEAALGQIYPLRWRNVGMKVEPTVSIPEDWDQTLPTSDRETRFAITGNLLAGFGAFEGRGIIGTYTTAGGGTTRGIILPRSMGADIESNFPNVMVDSDAAHRWLSKQSYGQVNSANGEVQIWRQRGAGPASVRIPRSRRLSSRYGEDTEITGLTVEREWRQQGQYLVAHVKERDLRGFMNLLQTKLGHRWQIPREGFTEGKPVEEGEAEATATLGSPTQTELRPAATAVETPAEPVRASDIVRDLQRTFVTIRKGFRGKAAAIYKVKPEIVRTKIWNRLPEIAHEAGHHLQKIVWPEQLTRRGYLSAGAFPHPLWSELVNMSQYSRSRPGGLKVVEGFAEFVRLWMLDPAEAINRAPNVYRHYTERLEQHPRIKRIMERAQSDIQTWIKQPADMRVESTLVRATDHVPGPGPTATVERFLDRVYYEFYDDLLPFWRGEEDMRQGRHLPPTKSPYTLLRVSRGSAGAAHDWIFEGVRHPVTGEALGPSLRDRLGPVAHQYEQFDRYIHSLHALEVIDRLGAAAMPLPRADYGAVVEARKTDTYEAVREDVADFQDQLLRLSVDSGILTPEARTQFRETWSFYVPNFRAIELAPGRRELRPGKPFMRVRGGGEDVRSPIDNIITSTFLLHSLGARNRAMVAAVSLAKETHGAGKWFEEVEVPLEMRTLTLDRILSKAELREAAAAGIDIEKVRKVFFPDYSTPGGKNIIRVFVKGEPKFYAVDPDIYQSLRNMDFHSTNLIFKALQAPARVLRAGAILTPAFSMFRNPMRDPLEAMMNSKFGLTPFDFVMGFYHASTKSPLYLQSRALGGSVVAMVSPDINYLARAARMIRERGTGKRIGDVVRHPIEALRAISEFFEEGTRTAEFLAGTTTRARRDLPWRERLGGMFDYGRYTDPDTLLDATVARREATIDFGRAGRTGRIVNTLKAFFNVALQGPNKVARTIRDHPTRTVMRGFTYLTLPTMLLYFHNRNNEQYQNLPEWEKDLFWILPVGDHLLRLPIPHTWGLLFKVLPERLMRYIDSQDPNAWDNVGQTIATTTAPANDPMDLIPGAFSPLAYAYANKTWTGTPIVPASEQDLPPEQQVASYTSGVARSLGQKLRVSPRQIDYMIQAYSGGLGKDVARVAGAAVEAIGAVEVPPRPSSDISDWPMVSAAMVRQTETPVQVERLYRRLQKLSHAQARAKKGTGPKFTDEQEAELADVKDRTTALAGVRRVIADVYEAPSADVLDEALTRAAISVPAVGMRLRKRAALLELARLQAAIGRGKAEESALRFYRRYKTPKGTEK